MIGSALEVIQALQKQLEEEGFTIYSRRAQDEQPTLIMYHTDEKKFAVIAFSSDDPGVYSRVDVWLTVAESKAEIFGKLEVAAYKVFKDLQQKWQIVPLDTTKVKV